MYDCSQEEVVSLLVYEFFVLYISFLQMK